MKKIILASSVLILIASAGCASARNSGDSWITSPQGPPNSSASGGGYGDWANDSAYSPRPEADYAYEAEYYEDYMDLAAVVEEYGRGDSANLPLKIIQRASINLQSERFDETAELLRAIGPDYGGYVESANMYTNYNYSRGNDYRTFSITIRVPSEFFEEARLYAESLGKAVHSSQSAEDATARYYDIADRLATKQIEEERVLEMITRAEEIDDLLALEERLGSIRTQIERFQSQMTSIDRLAAFSTISVSVTEVTKEELVIVPEGLGGRIGQAFVRSVNGTVNFFQNLAIFLAGALIPIVIIGLLAFVGYLFIASARKKKKADSGD